MTKKLVITGGHFTPGLALLARIDRSAWHVSWIGDEIAVEGKDIKSLEAQVLPGSDIPFYSIKTAKFHRTAFLYSLFSSWKFFYGVYQSYRLLQKVKPSIVLSFGSYVSVPVALAAWFLQIPVVIHEQTTVSGLANRLVARVAQKVAISFPQSKKYFPESKTVLIGNLIRKEVYAIARKREKRKQHKALPVLLITGGSRGSQAINQAVSEVLGDLLERFEIYHQCGVLDMDQLREQSERLDEKHKKNYHLQATFMPTEFEQVFLMADLALSRAGANTVSELAILGIPAVFVPIPWSEQDEQTKNAKMLKDIGIAQILPQSLLNGQTLKRTLFEMASNLSTYQTKTRNAQSLIPEDAGHKMIELLDATAQNG